MEILYALLSISISLPELYIQGRCAQALHSAKHRHLFYATHPNAFAHTLIWGEKPADGFGSISREHILVHRTRRDAGILNAAYGARVDHSDIKVCVMDAQPLNMRAGKSIKSAACSCATRSYFAIFHIRTNTKHWNLLLKIEFSLHASNYADQNVSLMPELFIYICSTLLYILYLYLLCKVIFGQRLNFCVIGLSDV